MFMYPVLENSVENKIKTIVHKREKQSKSLKSKEKKENDGIKLI